MGWYSESIEVKREGFIKVTWRCPVCDLTHESLVEINEEYVECKSGCKSILSLVSDTITYRY